MSTAHDPWRRHRLLKRVSVLGLTLFSPLLFLMVFSNIDLSSRGSRVLGACWAVFVILMIILFHEIKCPRCGQRFYVGDGIFWQMAARCLHCGMPKYGDLGAWPHRSSDSR